MVVARPLNQIIDDVVASTVLGNAGIVVGVGSTINGPFVFNQAAAGGISMSPHTLSTWNPSGSGGISGLAANNVLATDAGGMAVGAVFDNLT